MPEPNERPPIAHAPLSVVLFVPQTVANWADVLQQWLNYLESLNRDYEILLTYDRQDDAARAAEAPAAGISRLKVVAHETPGVGAALRSGLAIAQYPLFLYAECTPAYAPSDLGKFLEFIDHVDLVSGFREGLTGSSRPRSDWLYGLTLRFVFGLRLKDVDCSYKLFRRSIFTRIPIQSDGDFVHAEILAKANFLGCMIGEVAVRYTPQAAQNPAEAARRQRRKEALKLFRHPDFGPPVVSSETQ